jgi:hypothetical protein
LQSAAAAQAVPNPNMTPPSSWALSTAGELGLRGEKARRLAQGDLNCDPARERGRDLQEAAAVEQVRARAGPLVGATVIHDPPRQHGRLSDCESRPGRAACGAFSRHRAKSIIDIFKSTSRLL